MFATCNQSVTGLPKNAECLHIMPLRAQHVLSRFVSRSGRFDHQLPGSSIRMENGAWPCPNIQYCEK